MPDRRLRQSAPTDPVSATPAMVATAIGREPPDAGRL